MIRLNGHFGHSVSGVTEHHEDVVSFTTRQDVKILDVLAAVSKRGANLTRADSDPDPPHLGTRPRDTRPCAMPRGIMSFRAERVGPRVVGWSGTVCCGLMAAAGSDAVDCCRNKGGRVEDNHFLPNQLWIYPIDRSRVGHYHLLQQVASHNRIRLDGKDAVGGNGEDASCPVLTARSCCP